MSDLQGTAMVDANVIRYALLVPSKNESEIEARKRQDSSYLIRRHPDLRVSTLVVAEVYRYARTSEAAAAVQEALAWFDEGVEVDDAVGYRAAEILDRTLRKKGTCPKCWAPKKGGFKCAGCGLQRGPETKKWDAMILAHALMTEGVERIYSYDGAMQKAGPKGFVVKPPNSSGKLFENADELPTPPQD